MTDRELADETWYWYLNGKNKVGFPKEFDRRLQTLQHFFDVLPGTPRCLECHVPLGGAGAWATKPFGFRHSVLTPRLCNRCEKMILATEGGAEVELTLLFADIRGSTSMAEQQAAIQYKDFIQRFYKTAAQVLIERNALVNRLVGDQAIGLFVPRFAGANHAGVAIEAALDILRATGHAGPGGPWAPVGIGIHTGSAYVGAVGSKDGVTEIAVLGNAANLSARLSSKAAKGEVLISEQAAALAHLGEPGMEKRRLTLKGISKPVPVRVITVTPPQPVGSIVQLAKPRRATRKGAA
jgi:adenylate cyclase